jgi:hypothetical protein
MLRRLLVALVVLVAGALGVPRSSDASTTTAISAAISTYDVPALSRVDIGEFRASSARPVQASDVRQRSASPWMEVRGPSTTPSRSANATNTADNALEAVAPRVTFGHGARHLEGTGLSATQVESTILQRVTAEASQASTTGSFWGRVRINGTTIEYRAYTLRDGTINVGTYYVP